MGVVKAYPTQQAPGRLRAGPSKGAVVGLALLLLGGCAVWTGVLSSMTEHETTAARRVLADGGATPAKRRAAIVRLKADVLETMELLELAAKDHDPSVCEHASRAMAALHGRR